MNCKKCKSEMNLDNRDNGNFYWYCDCGYEYDVPKSDALLKLKEETHNINLIINKKKSFKNILKDLYNFDLDMIIYYIDKKGEECGGIPFDIYDEKIINDIDIEKEINISGYTSWCHFYITYIDKNFDIIINELRKY